MTEENMVGAVQEPAAHYDLLTVVMLCLGRAEGTIDAIRNLMANMGWPVEQAMTALNVPKAQRQKYRELLQKQ